MDIQSSSISRGSFSPLTTLYFVFKILPVFVSGISIYLGYRLFLLGITGQASIVVHAKDVGGQLVNAAPGLFFAVGGMAALIIIVWKGVEIRLADGPADKIGNLVHIEEYAALEVKKDLSQNLL